MKFESIPWAYRFRTGDDASNYALTGDKSLVVVSVIAEQTEDGLVFRINPEYNNAPWEFTMIWRHKIMDVLVANNPFKFDDTIHNPYRKSRGIPLNGLRFSKAKTPTV